MCSIVYNELGRCVKALSHVETIHLSKGKMVVYRSIRCNVEYNREVLALIQACPARKWNDNGISSIADLYFGNRDALLSLPVDSLLYFYH